MPKRRRRHNKGEGVIEAVSTQDNVDLAIVCAESELADREGPDRRTGGTSNVSRAARQIESWADDTARVEHWLKSRDSAEGIEPQLEAAIADGSILHMRDFFPRDIADSVFAVLQGLPEKVWELSEAAGQDDAAVHHFWSADLTDVPELLPLRSIFWRLLKTFRGEGTLPIFSCGRYGTSDHIGRHDDRAHVPFFRDDNVYSRTVAAIWYLTVEWSEAEGGCFLDLEVEDRPPIVPIYNSLVAFGVPRMHAVSAVTGDRYRYSIFGWWHQKGERYELPCQVQTPKATLTRKKARKGACKKDGAKSVAST